MAHNKVPSWGLHAAVATNDLTGKLGFIAKMDATNPGQVVLASAATDNLLGVVYEEAAAKGAASIQFAGIAAVVCGAAVTAGDRLTTDANGRAITAASNNQSIGIALASGVLNGVIPVAILSGKAN